MKRLKWITAVLAVLAVVSLAAGVSGGDRSAQNKERLCRPQELVLTAEAAETGAIQITYACDNGGTPISGAEFSLSKLAFADLTGGSIVYTMLEPYDRAGYDPDSAEYGQDPEMPSVYLDLYEQYCEGTAAVKTTGSRGTCRFGNCRPGLYLVWQSGRTGEALEYETSLPLVVSVPEYGNQGFSYLQAVYPKTVRRAAAETLPQEETDTASSIQQSELQTVVSDSPLIQPEEEISQAAPGIQPEADEEEDRSADRRVPTGDENRMMLWFTLAAASFAGTAWYTFRLHRRKRTGRQMQSFIKTL